MGREMGGRFKREGTYVYLWLFHVEVWQKTTKFCKAIIPQKKKKYINKKNHVFFMRWCEQGPNNSKTTQQECHLTKDQWVMRVGGK